MRRKIIVSVLGLGLLFSMCGCSTSTNLAPAQSVTESAPVEVVYTEYDAATLFDELKDNPLRAANHEKELVAVTGAIDIIDSSGSYFSITVPNDGMYEYFLDTITCKMSSDEHKEIIMNKSIGDVVTVYGTISDVGEFLGYTIKVDTIA